MMIKWKSINKEINSFLKISKSHLFLFFNLFVILILSSNAEADENDLASEIVIGKEWYNREHNFAWEVNGTYNATYNATLYIWYIFEPEDNLNAGWILYQNISITYDNQNITITYDNQTNINVTKGNFNFDFPNGTGSYILESNFHIDNGTSELGEGIDNFTGDPLNFDNIYPYILSKSFHLELKGEIDYDPILWEEGTEVNYSLFKSLKLNYSFSDVHSGVNASLILYSEDNSAWKYYNENSGGIKLDFSPIYIQVGIIDNAGNIEILFENPIHVVNLPIIDDSPIDEKNRISIDEEDGNNNLIFIVLIIMGVAFVFYKNEQGKSANKEKNIIASERTACPNCSVLVPQGSTNCTFCGEVWGKSENIALTNPFSQSEENVEKEIIPRTGEILIGTDIDRWKIDVGARSCVGGRKNNEDSMSWNTFLRITDNVPHSIKLGIVADGVGGHNKGEIASSMLISTFNQVVSEAVNDPFHTKLFSTKEHKDILEKAYHSANKNIFEKAQKEDYGGMATTAVSIYMWEDSNENNGFLIGNVGDSRGYLINKKEIKQVTKDDSEVQKLLDEGEISQEDAKNHPRKNVITQAIGNKDKITPRIETYDLQKSDFDYILLCSDGISDKMNEKELHKIINQFENPQDACDRIVKIINRTNTNHDNNSLILIKFPNLFMGGN